jgi:hypothetical protein
MSFVDEYKLTKESKSGTANLRTPPGLRTLCHYFKTKGAFLTSKYSKL